MIKKQTGKLERINIDFFNELRGVIGNRFKQGKDIRKISINKITQIIIKHNDWNQIKEDLEKVNIKEIRI